MIEAVNSSVVSASLLRSNAEQATSFQAVENFSLETGEENAPVLAPFVSPFIRVDTNFDTAVIQIRDSDTGDVLDQFPSEPALQTRQSVETFINGSQAAEVETQEEGTLGPTLNDTASGVETVQTVTVAQSAAPAQAQGAGLAQAAIAALSTGAQTGQVTETSVEVTA